jgi:hypothetical protein
MCVDSWFCVASCWFCEKKASKKAVKSFPISYTSDIVGSDKGSASVEVVSVVVELANRGYSVAVVCGQSPGGVRID